MDNVARRNEDLQSMVDDMSEVSASIEKNKAEYMADLTAGANDIQSTAIEFNATREDRVAHRNDWVKGATSVVKDAMNMDQFSNMGGDVGKIAGDTGSIKESLDVAEEDLKYLRDIAERETINRFTTAEIKVDMTNNNNINSELDIDGIVEQLGDKLEEKMEVVAEGVHN